MPNRFFCTGNPLFEPFIGGNAKGKFQIEIIGQLIKSRAAKATVTADCDFHVGINLPDFYDHTF